jgi:hypothetical protein
MSVTPVERVLDKKRIVGKNGGLRRRRGTRGRRKCWHIFGHLEYFTAIWYI